MNKTLLAALAACSAIAAPASAATVLFAGNGNYYEFVDASVSWDEANAAATASVFEGKTGYLATVTSQAENDFLSALGSFGWLGGTDVAVEGQWTWVGGPEAGQVFYDQETGETFGFSSWNDGEPNDEFGEDYLDLQDGNWNDLPASSTRGYFVEYSAAPGAVPEPATWAMLILGFGFVGGALRSAKQRQKVAISYA